MSPQLQIEVWKGENTQASNNEKSPNEEVWDKNGWTSTGLFVTIVQQIGRSVWIWISNSNRGIKKQNIGHCKLVKVLKDWIDEIIRNYYGLAFLKSKAKNRAITPRWSTVVNKLQHPFLDIIMILIAITLSVVGNKHMLEVKWDTKMSGGLQG